jgi:hypothetical protein
MSDPPTIFHSLSGVERSRHCANVANLSRLTRSGPNSTEFVTLARPFISNPKKLSDSARVLQVGYDQFCREL